MPLASSSNPPSTLPRRPQNTCEDSLVIAATLAKPFRIPLAKRASALPARKKRKVTSYAEDSPNESPEDRAYTLAGGPRVPLGGLDINALKSRRRESGEAFRRAFSVPVKENNGLFTVEKRIGYAPSLGMLRPVNFVPRPLHDPAGEFAIVLYDPTVDDDDCAVKPPEGYPLFNQNVMHMLNPSYRYG